MISLVLPFHTDFKRLQSTLRIINECAEQYKISEVILCHNGVPLSVENEKEIHSYMIPKSKLLHTNQKGLGAGYKLGIQNATQTYCVLSASDLPFGFTDIESFMKLNPLPVLAIGSKAHPESKIQGYGVKRKIASIGFWVFRACFLSLKTPKDSQGSIIINTDVAKKLIQMSLYNNYFFSVELITLAQKQGINPIEIPVVLENHEGDSSVSIVHDSWRLARDVIAFSKRMWREK